MLICVLSVSGIVLLECIYLAFHFIAETLINSDIR